MKIEVSFRVDASPDVVFQYLVEPDKMVMAWPNSLRSIEIEGGRPLELGSCYEAQCVSRSKRYTTRGEVTAFQQDQVVEIRVFALGHSGLNRTTLKSEGTSTIVLHEVQSTWGGRVGAVLAPLVRPRVKRDCETFRRIVEANSG
jgi:carbon monoxide dehydrogenase subunit G